MDNIKKQTIEHGLETYEYDPLKKETTPGLFVTAGEISEDYDKVDWRELLEDYTNMRNGGAVESTTVSILKYPILRAGWTIEHDDSKVVEYVEWCLDQMVDSFGDNEGFQELLNHMLIALEFGCAFFEKVYQQGVYTNDGKITNIIKRCAPFKPETIFRFNYNEEMMFSGIEHERRAENSMTTFVKVPAEKLFFYSHNAEFGDPRGRSELRPIRNLYKIKKDILLATARSQQRGAGIPEIQALKSGLSPEEKANLNAIGRSIGNMKSGYVVTDENIKITLHSLQMQGSPEKTLEFIDRQMFFNTLTEFMTSGIGQSGSRSATEEHKGSYELKCGVVIMSIEKRINSLIREMCDISYLGKLKKYPVFKINALNQIDIVSVADSIATLYEKAILVKQEGDEEFIRGLFKMPEKTEQIKTPTLSLKAQTEKPRLWDKDKIKLSLVLSSEDQLKFVKDNFATEATNKLYISTQEESERIILDVMRKYVNYIAKQKDSGEKVELKYDVELSNRLNKLYKKSFSEGVKQFYKEMELSQGKKLSTPLTVPEEKMIGTSQSITRYAGRLLFNVKTVVEDQIEVDILPGETAAEYTTRIDFLGGFKTDKRTLIQKTADGYLDGRSEALVDNKDKVELYYYNSVLDQSLCHNCAVLTGSVMTLDEAQSIGLVTGKGRINSNCLGGIWKCRCNLVPYQLKGDFTI